jgi:hypothetical protein
LHYRTAYSFTRFVLWLFHHQPHSQCFSGFGRHERYLSLLFVWALGLFLLSRCFCDPLPPSCPLPPLPPLPSHPYPLLLLFHDHSLHLLAQFDTSRCRPAALYPPPRFLGQCQNGSGLVSLSSSHQPLIFLRQPLLACPFPPPARPFPSPAHSCALALQNSSYNLNSSKQFTNLPACPLQQRLRAHGALPQMI